GVVLQSRNFPSRTSLNAALDGYAFRELEYFRYVPTIVKTTRRDESIKTFIDHPLGCTYVAERPTHVVNILALFVDSNKMCARFQHIQVWAVDQNLAASRHCGLEQTWRYRRKNVFSVVAREAVLRNFRKIGIGILLGIRIDFIGDLPFRVPDA